MSEWEVFDAGHLALCRWAAEVKGIILGWAAGTEWATWRGDGGTSAFWSDGAGPWG